MRLARVLPRKAVVLATVGLALGATIGTASPAFANNISGSDVYASWSYKDSTDTFCATSKNGQLIVKLSPVTAGRGPSYNQTVADGRKKCFSLATAYEDSKYKWAVGDRGQYNSGTFYS